MWEVENKMLTDKEVIEFIEGKPHKLIVMSGPTRCGKTKIVRSITSDKKHIITSDTFYNFALMLGRYNAIPLLNEKLFNAYKNFDYLIIEDIDMSSGAFNLMDHYATDFIKEYINRSAIIFTGVDTFRWGVFWELYKENKAVFVTYCEE